MSRLEWIPVGERLPDTHEEVLVYCSVYGTNRHIRIAYKNSDCWSENYHVSHWMPLPELPEETTT